MIIFNSREKMRCQELWFDEPEQAGSFDLISRNQASAPVPGKRSEEFHTLLVDLTLEVGLILSSFDSNTKSQIRAAEADAKIIIEIFDKSTADQFGEFLNFYDEFSRSKSIWPIWPPRLKALHETGRLILSRVVRDQETLVWHACLWTGNRFVVLYSASLRHTDQSFRKLVGQANRLLHWREMQLLKERGCQIYDFCGLYAGVEDKALLLVNRFKEEFGGRKVVEYNIFEEKTLKAKIVRTLKILISKFSKERRARWQRFFHAGPLLYLTTNRGADVTSLSL